MKLEKSCLAFGFVMTMVSGATLAQSEAAPPSGQVEVGPTAEAHSSGPLRSFPLVVQPHPYVDKAKDRWNPLAHEADRGKRGTWDRTIPQDPLVERGVNSRSRTPTPFLTFAGVGNPVGCGGCSPPDTVGDVGPNHYIQVVNATKVTVYSKAGALVDGPFDLSAFWSSGACTADAGDPIVNYDPLADRWVLSQFNGANNLCFAVSKTSDPLGEYWIYTFATTNFPDYFKVAVWPDAYYVSTNEANYNAWAFERPDMLNGASALSIKATGSGDNFLLAADVDGITPPPAGSPGLFYTFLDSAFHGVPSDRIDLRAFQVNWASPASSTFTALPSIAVASFTYTVCGFFNFNCAPQAGTAQKVDTVSEWPMYRLAYRNFGAHQSLVGNYSVAAATPARGAIRWFELRKVGAGAWTLFQEGTHGPSAASPAEFRFMGSIAQDRNGNLGLGYSHSSDSHFPSLRIATRLASDPLGTLGAEQVFFAGAGSQTPSNNRWGDYTAMSIDPADDCTFWYTGQYYPVSSSSEWQTRIGAFRIPECTALFYDNFEIGAATRWDSQTP